LVFLVAVSWNRIAVWLEQIDRLRPIARAPAAEPAFRERSGRPAKADL